MYRIISLKKYNCISICKHRRIPEGYASAYEQVVPGDTGKEVGRPFSLFALYNLGEFARFQKALLIQIFLKIIIIIKCDLGLCIFDVCLCQQIFYIFNNILILLYEKSVRGCFLGHILSLRQSVETCQQWPKSSFTPSSPLIKSGKGH